MQRRKHFLIACLLIILALPGKTLFGETNTSTLPPLAEEAFTRGMASAKVQEWELAIDYFEKALDYAPHLNPPPPQILFNLGLAYDKAPGAELVAIAWYRAYLAVMPEATNAGAIKTRIIELEVSIEAVIKKLFTMAVAGIQEEPDPQKRMFFYAELAQYQALMGERTLARQNYATARTILRNYDNPDPYLDNAYKKNHYLNIVQSQIAGGDFDGVDYTRIAVNSDDFLAVANDATDWHESTLTEIQALVDEGTSDETLSDEGLSLAKAGDFEGAKQKVTLVVSPLTQCATYIKILRIQAESGDIEGANTRGYSSRNSFCDDIIEVIVQSIEDKTKDTQGMQEKEIKTWISLANNIAAYKTLREDGFSGGTVTRDVQTFLGSFKNVKDLEWHVNWSALSIVYKAQSMGIDLWTLKKLISEIENAKT